MGDRAWLFQFLTNTYNAQARTDARATLLRPYLPIFSNILQFFPKKNSTSSLHMRTHTYIDRDRDRGRGRGIQQPTIYAPVLADLRDGSDSLLLEDLGAIVQRREDAVLQARLFGGIREVMHLRNLSNSRAP